MRERDRGRQRQGHDPRFRLKTPGRRERRSESLALEAHQVRAGLSLGRPGAIDVRVEAGGLPSSEAPLDHALRRGLGRAGPSSANEEEEEAWKLSLAAKAGGDGDSRIERSQGCLWRRSVADVGVDASSRAGKRLFGLFTELAERAHQGQLDAAASVDDGSRFAVGEKGAGRARTNVQGSPRKPGFGRKIRVRANRRLPGFRWSWP